MKVLCLSCRALCDVSSSLDRDGAGRLIVDCRGCGFVTTTPWAESPASAVRGPNSYWVRVESGAEGGPLSAERVLEMISRGLLGKLDEVRGKGDGFRPLAPHPSFSGAFHGRRDSALFGPGDAALAALLGGGRNSK